MPCHKRNPIPIAIAGRQAYIVAKPGEWHSVRLLPYPSLVLVIESNHLWLPNASEIMKRKPLCGASAARRSCLADNFVEATKLTKQIICENWISMNMNKAVQHERERESEEWRIYATACWPSVSRCGSCCSSSALSLTQITNNLANLIWFRVPRQSSPFQCLCEWAVQAVCASLPA